MICDELVSKVSEIFLGEMCLLRYTYFHHLDMKSDEVAIASLYGEEFNDGTFKIYFTTTGGDKVYTLFTGNSYHIYKLFMSKDSYNRSNYYIEDISDIASNKRQIASYDESYDELIMYPMA